MKGASPRLLILFAITIVLTSCQENSPSQQPPQKMTPLSFTGTVMTISYNIIIDVTHDTPATHDTITTKTSIESLITHTFQEIDQIYNRWNPHSELSQINHAKARQIITLSPSLHAFLVKTDQIVTLTEGKFDPTIEPLYQLWKQAFKAGIAPSPQILQETQQAVGWHHIHLSDNQTLWKDNDATSLDLGGIVKGYAVDLIVERLNEMGLNNVFVEWGGEIRASGHHPEGRPWRVGVSRFGGRFDDDIVAIVDLTNQSIASSGDYLQNWILDGISYTHIIDPLTGAPLKISLQSISSATVIAPSCYIADALATAAMLFPSRTEATAWLSTIVPEGSFWIYSREKTERGQYLNAEMMAN